MPTKTCPSPMLDAVRRHWADRGWLLDDLERIRMEAGQGAGQGDSGGQRDAGPGGNDGDHGGGDGGQGDEGDPDLGEAGKKAIAAERRARAEAEKRAKAAEAEAEKLRKAQMSEQEKAVNEAKETGRKEALAEAGQQVAAARIEAALTGIVSDPAAIVEDLNLAKYVDADGKVDTEAVKALAEKFRGLGAGGNGSGGAGGRKGPDLGQGRRQGAKPTPQERAQAQLERLGLATAQK